MPWLDDELDEDEMLDLELLQGGHVKTPPSPEIAAGRDAAEAPVGFSAELTQVSSTPTAPAAPGTVVVTFYAQNGAQVGANIDRALWARAEAVIRAMASKKGYTIVLGGSPGRSVRTLAEVSAFISDSGQRR